MNVTALGGTAVGYQAARNSTVIRQTAVGAYALKDATTGPYNTAVGFKAGWAITTGQFNTALGQYALSVNTVSGYNVALGQQALASVAGTASDGMNIGIGSKAGDNITSGHNNIVIGHEADASAVDVDDEITLGNSDTATLRLPGIGLTATDNGISTDGVFIENGQTVTANYTITDGKNAGSFGPITINSGITVTVGAGETWTVI